MIGARVAEEGQLREHSRHGKFIHQPVGGQMRGYLVCGPMGNQEPRNFDFLVAVAQDILSAKDGVVC